MKRLRSLHLHLSLIVSPTLLLFAAGSVPIAHHFLNPASTFEAVRRIEVPGRARDAGATAAFLASEHGVRGAISGIEVRGDELRFDLSRIGQHHAVRLAPLEPGVPSRTATITTQTQSLSGFLIALHTEVGIRDGSVTASLWRGLLGLIAVAMLAIVVTGGLLWGLRPKRLRPGVSVLVGSLCVGLLLLAIVRLG